MPGSFALTTLDARSTPSVPRSTAIFTHSPDWIPAPVRTLTFGFTAWTVATDLLMISGFAFDTETPLPISSGGSMATYSGESAAAAALAASLFVQTTADHFQRLQRPHRGLDIRKGQAPFRVVHERSCSTRNLDGIGSDMTGMCTGFDTVHVLGIDRYREVVSDRVKVDIGGGDPDSDPALPRHKFCCLCDHMGTAARPFFVGLQVDKDQW